MSLGPKAGQVLAKIAFIVVGLGLALGAIYYVLSQIRLTLACTDNLKVVYRALELYEMERGTLPKLAFYPDNPIEDGDSLRVVLEAYGAGGSVCICPQAPHSQSELGLTYVWNVRLNGRKIPPVEERDWMLVEMGAVSTDVPAPHLGRYNVLYTDGTVEHISDPLTHLRGL
jgi:hypothetical protein